MRKNNFSWKKLLLLAWWMSTSSVAVSQTLPVEGLEQQLSELLRLDMQRALENEKRALQPRTTAITVVPAPSPAPVGAVAQPAQTKRMKLLALYGVGEDKKVLMQLYERVYEMKPGDARSTSKGKITLEHIRNPCVQVKVGKNKRAEEVCMESF